MPADPLVGTLGGQLKQSRTVSAIGQRCYLTACLALSLVGARDVSEYSKGAACVEGESSLSAKALSDKHAHGGF